MIIKNQIDMLDTMYPSYGEKVVNALYHARPYSTIYGYIISGDVEFPNSCKAIEGQYFSAWTANDLAIRTSGEVVIFTRLGYKGQFNIGGPLENSGRLCYIDGCSDSLLIYPPRQGDPSLNLLHFPENTQQTFHIHPSIRLGVVIRGEGLACIKEDGIDKQIELKPGNIFCIEEREAHRFMTIKQEMVVLAFHPDGDWGPTDHDHTMLNRTYLIKR